MKQSYQELAQFLHFLHGNVISHVTMHVAVDVTVDDTCLGTKWSLFGSVWCLGRSRDLVRCYALFYSGSQCHILRSCPPCLHVEHCGTLFHVDVLGVPFFILSCISNSRSARLWGSAKHARAGQGCRLLETIHHGWFIRALCFFWLTAIRFWNSNKSAVYCGWISHSNHIKSTKTRDWVQKSKAAACCLVRNAESRERKVCAACRVRSLVPACYWAGGKRARGPQDPVGCMGRLGKGESKHTQQSIVNI